MRKSKLIAVIAAGLLALSSLSAPQSFAGSITPPPAGHSHIPAGIWVIFGCAGDIILAAWVAHQVYHRELTQAEALTCGLGFWLNPNKK
jgi:hypothetical protein